MVFTITTHIKKSYNCPVTIEIDTNKCVLTFKEIERIIEWCIKNELKIKSPYTMTDFITYTLQLENFKKHIKPHYKTPV